MKNDLSLLIKLQKLDLEIDDTIEGRNSSLSQIQELEKKIFKQKEDLSNKEAEFKQIQVERRKREREIEEIDGLLDKHEEEKYKVKSQDEFAALEKEIAQKQEKKSKLEDSLLELMEREEELADRLPSFKEETEQKERDITRKKKILSQDLENFNYKEKMLQEERRKLASQIDSLLLEQYEQLRRTKDKIAVAPIKNGSCEGCQVKVSPSLINRVKRGEITYCENCNRILYMP